MFGSQSSTTILLSTLTLAPSLSLASVSSSWVLDHLGNLSPYHKAPVASGIQEALPADCKVDQVFYVRLYASLLWACSLISRVDGAPRLSLSSCKRIGVYPGTFSQTCGSFCINPKGEAAQRAWFLEIWLQYHLGTRRPYAAWQAPAIRSWC